MKKILFSCAAFVAALALFSACSPEEPKEESLFLDEAGVEALTADGKLYTLNELLDTYMTETGDEPYASHYRTRANASGGVMLFAIDTLPTDGPGIWIRGRVTTDDYGGNFYKSMCIQQMVNGKQQALRISLDGSNASGMFPLGQEILIRCNGFAIGRYADQPQLCVPTYNNNYTASNADQKMGWAPGRIPWERVMLAFHRIGKPNQDSLFVEPLDLSTLFSITDEKTMRYWDGKLVRITNVHYTGTYENNGNISSSLSTGNPENDPNANVFAPTTNNIGYPQSRVIEQNGQYTLVSCSEYAKFAYFYIPGADASGVSGCPDLTGTVTGILGQYRDNGKYDHDSYDWSITPRDLSDLNFEGWTPKEYGE